MKVAVIEPSGNLYGSELALFEILQGIIPLGVDAKVFLPKNAAFSERLASAGIDHCEVLLSEGHKRSRARKLPAYLRLLREIKKFDPDLIYVNEAGILRPISKIASVLRKPILCQVQTLEDASWISSKPAIHKRVNAFICNSRFIAGETDVDPYKKSTVYYGYSSRGFTREISPKRETLKVGLLGRIGGTKGHHLLLEAAAKLKAQEAKVEFVFIGEAPDQVQAQEWRRRVSALGLSDMIEFRGYCEDIESELARIHLMVIPSRAEPFGRILCEAAEFGVPVLLSDSGGLGELSHYFDIGVRHAPEDSENITRRILEIKKNYATVLTEFQRQAPLMLSRLDYKEYVRTLHDVVCKSVEGNVSLQWLGTNSEG